MSYLRTKILRGFSRTTFLVAIAPLILISLVSCSDEPQFLLLFEQQTGPPDWTRRVYSVSPDGSDLELLIELDGKTAGFYWLSPSGKHIAVLNRVVRETASTGPLTRTLSVIDLSTKQTITTIDDVGQTHFEHLTNESSVAWSPQGDKLAFVRNAVSETATDLWVYGLKTNSTTPLTNDAALDLAPVWSPDGEQIAFVTGLSCQGGIDDCSIPEAFWEVAVVDAKGSNKRVLSNFHSNSLLEFSGWASLLCNLVWSPDGKYIAFENDCGILLGPPTTKEVFVISTDSTLVLKLTDFVNEQVDVASTIFRYSFHWVPSSTILYVGYSKIPYVPDEVYRGGFLLFEADDFTYSPVEDMPAVLGNTARWSPDGQYLAWHSARINSERRLMPGPVTIGQNNNNQISELDNFSQLPYGSCWDSTILWSPNGQFVSYAMVEEENICDDDKRSIVVVSISDAQVVNVTESFEGDNHPIGWIQLNALKP